MLRELVTQYDNCIVGKSRYNGKVLKGKCLYLTFFLEWGVGAKQSIEDYCFYGAFLYCSFANLYFHEYLDYY